MTNNYIFNYIVLALIEIGKINIFFILTNKNEINYHNSDYSETLEQCIL